MPGDLHFASSRAEEAIGTAGAGNVVRMRDSCVLQDVLNDEKGMEESIEAYAGKIGDEDALHEQLFQEKKWGVPSLLGTKGKAYAGVSPRRR